MKRLASGDWQKVMAKQRTILAVGTAMAQRVIMKWLPSGDWQKVMAKQRTILAVGTADEYNGIKERGE